MKYSAVIFDVFGTLIPISEGRSPYRPLMKWFRENGRRPTPDDAAILLSHDFKLCEIGQIFGLNPPNELLLSCEDELQLELSNLQIYGDVESAFDLLKQAGIRIGLCSNLAAGYGRRVVELLPDLDAYSFSYQVGTIKPDPVIYQHVLNQLQCSAESTLFIGDTLIADVEAPRSYGMSARLLERKNGDRLDTQAW